MARELVRIENPQEFCRRVDMVVAMAHAAGATTEKERPTANQVIVRYQEGWVQTIYCPSHEVAQRLARVIRAAMDIPTEVQTADEIIIRLAAEHGATRVFGINGTVRLFQVLAGGEQFFTATGGAAKRMAEAIHKTTGMMTVAVAGKHTLLFGQQAEGEIVEPPMDETDPFGT